jgi:competence protein ComEA
MVIKSLSWLMMVVLLVLAPLVQAEPLDINTATEEQFDEVLVGVGKSKAKAIVADREKNGPFKSVDDLARVKGIGPATVEKNRSKITTGEGSATPTAAKPEAPAQKPRTPAATVPPPLPAAPATPAKMP